MKYKINVGTKSVLFGAHCFFIHPIFVFIAWWKLYGFPWDPRLWVAFIVHDLGYLGKPNMDGPEGETHVELGAKIMSIFDYRFLFKKVSKVYKDYPYYNSLGFKEVFIIGKNKFEFVFAKRNTKVWSDFSLYHSRFYAKKDGVNPSKLCIADKLSIAITPAWLYLPLVNLTGEIKEYMELAGQREASGEFVNKYESMKLNSTNQKEWYSGVQAYLLRWVEAHKDNQHDIWTPVIKHINEV